jgi:acyl transferase domain-containing protein
MKEGYFLRNDCRKFDNAFFGINPVETKTLDPDQRQLLEVAYECLESAGITLEDIAESTTGVFMGSGGSDYPLARYQDTDYATTKPYAVTGSAPTMTSNRLSYVFDLTGPRLVWKTQFGLIRY